MQVWTRWTRWTRWAHALNSNRLVLIRRLVGGRGRIATTVKFPQCEIFSVARGITLVVRIVFHVK